MYGQGFQAWGVWSWRKLAAWHRLGGACLSLPRQPEALSVLASMREDSKELMSAVVKVWGLGFRGYRA